MLTSRLLMFAMTLVCLVFVVNAASVARAETACSGYTHLTLTVRGVYEKFESTDADLLATIEAWQPDGDRFYEVIGRPIAHLYLDTDGTTEQRCYALIYASRTDPDAVVVGVWSYERMFGDHDDKDLHHHPDMPSGSLPRTELDTLLAAISS